MREPQALGLGRRVHELVRDAADVDLAQVALDVGEGPLLGARGVRREGVAAAVPDDAVNAVLGVARQAVAERVERGHFLALQDVDGVNLRGPVRVRPHGVDLNALVSRHGLRRPVQ